MEAVVLRPDRAASLRWTVGAAVLVAFAAWFVVDAAGAAPAWVLLGLSVALAAWFAGPLVAPGRFTVVVDADGVRARTAWQALDVAWDQVRAASVQHLAGEPYLRVEVIEEVTGGWVVTPRTVPVPLGADVGSLRVALARAAGTDVDPARGPA